MSALLQRAGALRPVRASPGPARPALVPHASFGGRSGVAQLGAVRAQRPTPAGRQQVKATAFFKRESPPPLDPDSPEQVALRASAGWQKSLSFVAFWLQLGLTLVSAGVLIFSLAVTGEASGALWPRYFTVAGVAFAFLSTFFAHGFLRIARKLSAGEVVAPGWISESLIRCNALNVAGIGATVIGLQAAVGTLVAKSLVTSTSTPYSPVNAANALVSLDVFSLQAATNTLLAHLVSLIFTNLLLRVTAAARAAASPPPTNGGVTVGADGLSPVRPSSLGYSPWTLKAD